MLTLSLRDRDRIAVLRQVDSGKMSASRGAELLGLSTRQFRRLRRRFEVEGDGAVIHRLRGRRPNNAKPLALRAYVLERAADPLFHDFRPTLLAEHLSRDPQVGPLRANTLRTWLIEAGHWQVRRRRARHRKARPRRAAVGELIQWDSSEHAWLEDRFPGRFCLIKMVDDATNRIHFARFVARDTGAANRLAVIEYLRCHGRPVAFYTDKAGHFAQRTRPVSKTPLEERDAKLTRSIIRSALEALNIQLILAHSPEAKGRVERDFGTSQDRLIKELRVAGIDTLEAANRFLQDIYVPFWNRRFAVDPADPKDRHRRLPKRADLERLFAETLTRTVSNDFTIILDRHKLQIPKEQARGLKRGDKLTVERRLDGSTRFRSSNRYLELEPVADFDHLPPRSNRAQKRATKKPAANKPAAKASQPKPRPMPPRPGPDHPWRRGNTLVANPRPLAAARRAKTSTPNP